MVIWVTGLSGSGKTTLCTALYKLLKPRLPELVLLDGDAVRRAIGDDLGYSESERRTHVQRVQRLAKLLSDQGLVAVVAVLYSHLQLLDWNRRNMRGYFEVHLSAPLEKVAARDAKGLYAKARRGEITDVVGVDIPWHPPASPDLVIDADMTPPAAARQLALRVPRLASALPPEGS